MARALAQGLQQVWPRPVVVENRPGGSQNIGADASATGLGPVTKVEDLKPAMDAAVKAVREGATCVVDVRLVPGYEGATK